MHRLFTLLLLAALPALADPLLRPEAPAMPLRPAATLLATPPEEVENRPKGRNAHDLNRRISNITTPTIAVYLPPEGVATLRTGVVICPGGGYSGVVIDKEGHDYARYLASRGVTGLVLKYRLPDGTPPASPDAIPAPLADALDALRWLRAHADQLDLDPDRIGIIGSSAGGHLAASAAAFAPADARPDFLVLIYPVITMDPDLGHAGSRERLLGPNPSPELIQRFSIEHQVTANFPPTFLVHAKNDPVKVENSLRLLDALAAAGIPASPQIFETGGHGFGLARKHPTLSVWPDQLLTWLTGLP